MMYILNIINVIKKMTVEDLREFTSESYYKQIGRTKEDGHYLFKKQRERRFVILAKNLTKSYSKSSKVSKAEGNELFYKKQG